MKTPLSVLTIGGSREIGACGQRYSELLTTTPTSRLPPIVVATAYEKDLSQLQVVQVFGLKRVVFHILLVGLVQILQLIREAGRVQLLADADRRLDGWKRF